MEKSLALLFEQHLFMYHTNTCIVQPRGCRNADPHLRFHRNDVINSDNISRFRHLFLKETALIALYLWKIAS